MRVIETKLGEKRAGAFCAVAQKMRGPSGGTGPVGPRVAGTFHRALVPRRRPVEGEPACPQLSGGSAQGLAQVPVRRDSTDGETEGVIFVKDIDADACAARDAAEGVPSCRVAGDGPVTGVERPHISEMHEVGHDGRFPGRQAPQPGP